MNVDISVHQQNLKRFPLHTLAVPNKRISCLLALPFLISLLPVQAQEWQSAIVFEGEGGRLEYVADEEGNRIPDFSNAGYRGGGVALPVIPVIHTISPVEGDNTAHIQEALDSLSTLQPDQQGIRGALLLEAGVYEVSSMLSIKSGGIVIRGVGNEGDGASNTIIRRVGNATDPVLRIGSGITSNAWAELSGTRSDITSPFVQVGSRSFTVANPGLYDVGDQIVILHPMTEAWIAAVDGGGTATDPPWETDEFDIAYTRRILDIQDDRIFIDAPVFNHLDKSLVQSYIYKRDSTGEIQEVGVENLRIFIDTNGPTSEDHAETAVEFVHVANAWVDEVNTLHFVYAGVDVRRSMHVTVRNSEALEPHSRVDGGRRYNFAVYRSQLVLFENNLATEARHAYVGNGEAWDSGIVFLNNISRFASTSSEPHRHWGQGFLYDNHQELGSAPRQLRLRLGNRGSFGTGHGWSAVHSVAWNCKMNGSRASIEKPPTAQNYAIGCEGDITGTQGSFRQPAGYIEGANRAELYPTSLYEKQLEDRLSTVLSVDPSGEGEVPEVPVLSISHFPNPFVANATIRVHLEEPGKLNLGVYDILGRRITTLADRVFSAGVHEFSFADQPGSGVYILRGEFTGTRKKDVYVHPLVRVQQ